MAVAKKRVIKSLDNLPDELRDMLKKQYPNGYEASVTRIVNAKKEQIFVFPLEAEEAVYLIKVPATKNSEGEYKVDFGRKKEEFEPPDTVEEFNGEEPDFESEEGDFDGDGGDRPGKDPSYEPDFDN